MIRNNHHVLAKRFNNLDQVMNYLQFLIISGIMELMI